jgi:hypothetical protein
MSENIRREREKREQEALDAFLGRSVKTKAPAEMVWLFPFLDQPGLQCPSLRPSVADGILLALEAHRHIG